MALDNGNVVTAVRTTSTMHYNSNQIIQSVRTLFRLQSEKVRQIIFLKNYVIKRDLDITVLNNRSSRGKTTRCETLM